MVNNFSLITGNTGKNVTALGKKGKSVSDIARALGKSEEEVISHFRAVGTSWRFTAGSEEAMPAYLRRHYHRSVVAALTGVDDSGIDQTIKETQPSAISLRTHSTALSAGPVQSTSISTATESADEVARKIVELSGQGWGIRQVITELNIDSRTYADAMRNHRSPQKNPGEPTTPAPVALLPQASHVPTVPETAPAPPMEQTKPEGSATGSVQVTERVVITGPNEPRDSLPSRIRELAEQRHTFQEISERLGISTFEVYSIATKHSIFAPYNPMEKVRVDLLVRLAGEGKTLAEIADTLGASPTSLRVQAKKIIEGRGAGHESLLGLVPDRDGQSAPDNAQPEPVEPEPPVETEPEAQVQVDEPAKTEVSPAEDPSMPTTNFVENQLAVIRAARPEVREEIWDYGDRRVRIISILDNVAMVQVGDDDDDDDAFVILVRLSELRPFRDESDWLLGEKVCFELDDEVLNGVIDTPALRLDGDVRYGVRVGDRHELVSASDFLL